MDGRAFFDTPVSASIISHSFHPDHPSSPPVLDKLESQKETEALVNLNDSVPATEKTNPIEEIVYQRRCFS